jgi:enhancing lycopene biosynthesis protein 2
MPFGGLLTMGLITGVSSIAQGVIGANAAGNAADTQAAAEQKVQDLASQTVPQANDLLQQNYGTNMGLVRPYTSTGSTALAHLDALVNGGGFTAPTGVTEQNDPGYQFRMQQGELALDRSAAAQGEALGGGQLQAAQP